MQYFARQHNTEQLTEQDKQFIVDMKDQNLRYVISNIIKNLDPKPYYHSEEF